MLKWKFQSGDLDMESRKALERAGIDCQRQSLARGTTVRENKELKETIESQKRFIETLISDKEKSLKMLESVMEEFSRLDKQITMAEEEVSHEKQLNERLQAEAEHWKTECKNLQVCSYILQSDLYNIPPNSRGRDNRRLARGDMHRQPMGQDLLPISQEQPIQRCLSQDENFQNIENESRLDCQTSWTASSMSTVPAVCTRHTYDGSNILTVNVKKISSPTRAIVEEGDQSLHNESTQIEASCFKYLLRKLRKGAYSR